MANPGSAIIKVSVNDNVGNGLHQYAHSTQVSVVGQQKKKIPTLTTTHYNADRVLLNSRDMNMIKNSFIDEARINMDSTDRSGLNHRPNSLGWASHEGEPDGSGI